MSIKALDSLIERVRVAREARGTLAIRGGGTKSFYGEPVQGRLLDVRCLSGITRYEALPAAARAYVARLVELIGGRLGILSVGPGRENTLRLEI